MIENTKGFFGNFIDRCKLEKENKHQKASVLLYGAGKNLLDICGRERSKMIVSEIEGERLSPMGSVEFRETPLIRSMKIEGKNVSVIVSEDFTPQGNGRAVMDRMLIKVSDDRGIYKGINPWKKLLDVSITTKETKYFGKKASTGQLKYAGELFQSIGKEINNMALVTVKNGTLEEARVALVQRKA